MNNTIITKIAVGVGEVFAIVNSNEVRGISLKKTDTIVIVDDKAYCLYKGSTFDDSLKIDDLLDTGKYKERKIKLYDEKNLKCFDITISRLGCLKLKATSKEEALVLANKTATEAVEWNEDWEVTDINEEAE